ncbi:hypothetical protein [Leptospira adleri]|uniref:hypothetical protein n=1 Tax=Leptospira adleri TaxID=2023186 RepID=UPI001083E282|nr:hypothetical protein [Leptospira adleri]TGM58668.1 hypothetical protein EHQ97_06135 [Leptospira adleri]
MFNSNLKGKYTVFLILLLVSIALNLFFAFTKVTQVPDQCSERASEINSTQQHELPKEWVSSAEILPHPPEFFKGRKIRFLSYQVRKIDGRSWILFKEKRGAVTVETKVDAEAVRWF